MPARVKLRRRRRTKIVATLGPASCTAEVLSRLFYGGADVFRLNFSHGTHEDHLGRIKMIRALETSAGRPIGILADVQGPKLRVGRFGGGRVTLQTGQAFRLDLSPVPGDRNRVQLPHPEIIQAAGIGTNLLLDDGKLRLRVVRARDDHLEYGGGDRRAAFGPQGDERAGRGAADPGAHAEGPAGPGFRARERGGLHRAELRAAGGGRGGGEGDRRPGGPGS